MRLINYLLFISIFVVACGNNEAKKNIPQQQNTIYTENYCDCSFSDTVEIVVKNWLATVRKNSQQAIMLHFLDTCLVYDDFICVHNRGVDYWIQISDKYISFNKSAITISDKSKNKSFDETIFIAQPQTVQVPKNSQILDKIDKTNIWKIKPQGGVCIGEGCLILKIKKDGVFINFEGLSQQDTLFKKACAAVEKLVKNELSGAGVTF